MDNVSKLDPIQPRFLRYRSHYRIYLIFLLAIALLLLALWSFRLYLYTWEGSVSLYPIELFITSSYLFSLPFFYFFWLRPRLNHVVQAFSGYVLVHKGKVTEQLLYANVDSVSVIGCSLFYFKMKDGQKYYFSSDLERVDYIWEGICAARPDLITPKEFEDFRVELVQYDHHQKRREWFFRHKLVDVGTWVLLPLFFMAIAWAVQSREVVIHHYGLYFFRLFMYSLLILLVTSFAYSILLKKFVFDKKLEEQKDDDGFSKLRDLEFEGVIIQRSKFFHLLTSCFIFAVAIRADINFYSLSKTKGDLTRFNIPSGKTLVVDNRYNCFDCRYRLNDGDIVMFGRGIIGQVLAGEGEPVGEIVEDTQGRAIASLNVQTVPKGHVAVKTSNGKNIIFIKIVDLIGKVQK